METLFDLGVAFGLGLLVGLQREWADANLAGVRTFPLFTLLGAICALLEPTAGGWPIVVGLASIAAFFVVGEASRVERGKKVGGLTTEAAALVMFGIGVLAMGDTTWLAVVLGGSVAVLLHAKGPLHRLIEAFEARDLRGVMQLVLVALVVLPVVPDQAMGPYDVVNPQHAWLMVVLIVGISLLGYVAQRLAGPRVGSVLAGVLGGLVSSTATTVAESRRTASDAGVNAVAAVVVVVASAVSFVRLLVEVAVAAPSMLPSVGPPLAVMALLMVGISLLTLVLGRAEPREDAEPSEPTDLAGAVFFGVIYVVVLVLVEAARDQFGERGMYVVAALSGLTDVDAITLSTANLAADGRLAATLAWRVILVAGMANMVFKLGMVVSLGSRGLAARTALAFIAAIAGGVAILLGWPT